MKKNLKKLRYTPFPVSAIKPSGWLKKQLEIQLQGLSGNLDLFWPDIKDSHWFGGTAEGWERAPYWLDGVIPLAYLMRDAALTKRVEKYIAYIVKHQHEDGWLGPKVMGSALAMSEQHAHYDIWAQFLALKMLTVYADCTDKEQQLPEVTAAIDKGLRSVLAHIDRAPLFNWGQARWFECLIPVYWLYERCGEEWLLELAAKIRAQGFDWGAFFENWPYKKRTRDKNWNYMSHIVNNTMAIKEGALWYRFSGKESDLRKVYNQIDLLDKYHGTAVGMPSGDECLAGKDPRQGTELCSIVEYMYSLEWLLQIIGDPVFADRLELLAFNPLMATFDDAMWAHQYDQQSNQLECSIREDWPWVSNRPDANTFGLEPDFGCCTANFSQGWPKYAMSLWMQESADKIVCMSYAPVEIFQELEGGPRKISVQTGYPHRDTVKIIVDNKAGEFWLKLRIPHWADGATVEVSGTRNELSGGGYFYESLIGAGETVIEMKFDFPVTANSRGECFSVQRGPVVFALPVQAEWKRIHADWPQRELPHADWELFPESRWNYTLADIENACVEQNDCEAAFDSANPAQVLHVRGTEIVNWMKENGCHADFPVEPRYGDEVVLKLVPYACAKLRITEFPKAIEKQCDMTCAERI